MFYVDFVEFSSLAMYGIADVFSLSVLENGTFNFSEPLVCLFSLRGNMCWVFSFVVHFNANLRQSLAHPSLRVGSPVTPSAFSYEI